MLSKFRIHFYENNEIDFITAGILQFTTSLCKSGVINKFIPEGLEKISQCRSETIQAENSFAETNLKSCNAMKQLFRLSVIFLSVILPFLSQGQSKGFQLGIEGGPGLTTIRSDPFISPSNAIWGSFGGAVGFTLKYNISDRLALKTSFGYETGKPGPHEQVKYLNYLTIPILFQVKFGMKPMFFINLGPYFSYLLPSRTYGWHYKEFDAGVSMGVGVGIPLSSKVDMTFEIRNNVGFVNIQSGSTFWYLSNTQYQNLVIMQIGFTYNLDKMRNQ